MAMSDYYLCDVCNRKAIYDADIYERWDEAGAMAIICKGCAKSHAVRVIKLPDAAVSALAGSRADQQSD